MDMRTKELVVERAGMDLISLGWAESQIESKFGVRYFHSTLRLE